MPTTEQLPPAVQVALGKSVNKSVNKLCIEWATYFIHNKPTAFSQEVHRLLTTEDHYRIAWAKLGARLASGKTKVEKNFERPGSMARFALSTHASPQGVCCAAAYLAGMRLAAPPIPDPETPGRTTKKGKQ